MMKRFNTALSLSTSVFLFSCIAPTTQKASYIVAPRGVSSVDPINNTGGSGGGTTGGNASTAAGITEFRITLGNRFAAASTFVDIFGGTTAVSGGKTVNSVMQVMVVDQISSWGGSCDPYANSFPMPTLHSSGNYTIQTIETPSVRGCGNHVYSQAALLPASSTSRLAWTIRACDQILSADAAVRAAATQAGYPAGSSLNTPPNEAMIRAVFDLFHPGVPLDTASYAALKGVVDTANSNYANSNESWRYLFLTVCTTPGWQML